MEHNLAQHYNGELVTLDGVRIRVSQDDHTFFYFDISNWPSLGYSIVGTKFAPIELAQMFREIASQIERGPPADAKS